MLAAATLTLTASATAGCSTEEPRADGGSARFVDPFPIPLALIKPQKRLKPAHYVSCEAAVNAEADSVCVRMEAFAVDHQGTLLCPGLVLHASMDFNVLLIQDAHKSVVQTSGCSGCAVIDAEVMELSSLEVCLRRLTHQDPRDDSGLFDGVPDLGRPASARVRRARVLYRQTGSDQLRRADLECEERSCQMIELPFRNVSTRMRQWP
jgi:hypothetical protein